MAEPSTLDKLLDLLNPLPKEAQADVWSKTFPLLEKMAQAVLEGGKASKVETLAMQRAMNPRSVPYKMLERLTEGVPAVKRAKLYEFDPSLRTIMERGSKGKSLPLGEYGPDYHYIELNKPIHVRSGVNPFGTYGHESGHAWMYGGKGLGGEYGGATDIDELVKLYLGKEGYDPAQHGYFSREVRRAIEESFADSIEQGTINQVTAPNYGGYYKRAYGPSHPWRTLYPEVKWGVGKRAAESLLSKEPMAPRAIWEQIMDMVDKYMKKGEQPISQIMEGAKY